MLSNANINYWNALQCYVVKDIPIHFTFLKECFLEITNKFIDMRNLYLIWFWVWRRKMQKFKHGHKILYSDRSITYVLYKFPIKRYVLEVTDTNAVQITGLRIRVTHLNLSSQSVGWRKLHKSANQYIVQLLIRNCYQLQGLKRMKQSSFKIL